VGRIAAVPQLTLRDGDDRQPGLAIAAERLTVAHLDRAITKLEEKTMAFIRHVAIASKDPAATAEFYKKHFDLKELYRQPKESGDEGVWLSDGYIYFAILKHGPNAPKLGPDQSSDYCGIHHIGFMVDDQRAKVAELEAANVPYVQDNPEGARRASLIRNAPNEKFIGPDWVHFDVRERGWNEAIRSNTQLYELKPVTSDR
jgi:catechol 2,3-dioxygenase-like lactoylglutathione lyase family enzyme